MRTPGKIYLNISESRNCIVQEFSIDSIKIQNIVSWRGASDGRSFDYISHKVAYFVWIYAWQIKGNQITTLLSYAYLNNASEMDTCILESYSYLIRTKYHITPSHRCEWSLSTTVLSNRYLYCKSNVFQSSTEEHYSWFNIPTSGMVKFMSTHITVPSVIMASQDGPFSVQLCFSDKPPGSVPWPTLILGQKQGLNILHVDACVRNVNGVDGVLQYCCNSNTLAMELLQSCPKPSIYSSKHRLFTITFRTNQHQTAGYWNALFYDNIHIVI